MSDSPQRLQFLADLARIVDDEPDALEQYAETLAQDADAAQVLEQARAMAAHIGAAGDDFRPDPELLARLKQSLPESPRAPAQQGAPQQRSESKPQPDGAQPEDAQVVDEHDDDESEQRAPRLSDFPAAARRFEKPKSEGRKVAKAPSSGTKRGLWAGLALVVIAGAGFAASKLMEPPPPPPPVVDAAPKPKNRLMLRLVATRSAGEGGQLKATQTGGGKAALLDIDATAGPGQKVSTDSRTRGMFALGKPGRLVLGTDTELLVATDHDGQLSLLRGHTLIDAQGSDAPVLTLTTPAGSIALADCLLHVRLRGDGVDIDVLRGSAVLGGKTPVTIRAGQQGRITKDKPPLIGTAWGLSPELDFARFGQSAPEASYAPGMPELTWTLVPKEQVAPAVADGGLPDATVAEEPPELPALTAQHVEVEIQGHTARTILTHDFRAPERNGIARYRLPLPADATWTGLSMEVEGEWQAAQPADSEGAGGATTDTDGATSQGVLQVDGLPVVAGQALRLRVEYLQVMRPTAHGRHYLLPLPRTDGTDAHRFAVHAQASDGRVLWTPSYAATFDAKKGLQFEDAEFVPNGDFAIEVERKGEDAELQVWSHVDASGDATGAAPGYVALSLRPRLTPKKGASVRRPLAILVDTSQSMADERLLRANAVTAAILDSLHSEHPVTLLACDRVCAADQAAPATAGALRAKDAPTWITRGGAAGASDLSSALAHAQTLVDVASKGEKPAGLSLIYIGDGEPSLGDSELPILAKQAARLHADGRATLSTVALGEADGRERLGELAQAGGGHHVHVSAQSDTTAAARGLLLALARPRLSDVHITLPEGVEGEFPEALPPLTDGEEITLLAKLSARAISGELTVMGSVRGFGFKQVYPVEFEAGPDEAQGFVTSLYHHGTYATHARSAAAPQRATTLKLGDAIARVLRRQPATDSRGARSVTDTDPVTKERLEAELASLSEQTDKKVQEAAGRTPRAKRRSWLIEHTGPYEALLRSVDDTRAAAEAEGGGERERDLHARALARLGNFERTRKFVDGWRAKLPDSPLALLHKAELLMQQGQPAEALRMLAGIIDLRPADRGIHGRLARAYERSGRKREACAHLLAAARLGEDAEDYVSALRCLDTTGQEALAERFRASIGGTQVGARVALLESKAAAEAKAGQAAAQGTPERDPERVRMEVTWKPKQDLDVYLTTIEGGTLSWIGGRADLEVAGARSKGGERLEFDAAPGIYQVAVRRRSEDADADAEGKITGEVMIDLPDGRQRANFEFTGPRRSVTRIVIMPKEGR